MPQKTISEQGINLIKTFEQLRLTPYLDTAGHLTIGYGHLIRPGEHFTSISPTEADQILQDDLQTVTTAINSSTKAPLNQYQFDALASLVFNIGSSAFENSTLLKLLNARNYSAAALQFLRWDKATVNGALVEEPGLRRRRQLEEAIFRGSEETY